MINGIALFLSFGLRLPFCDASQVGRHEPPVFTRVALNVEEILGCELHTKLGMVTMVTIVTVWK